MAELMLVLLGLLVVATPFITLFLIVRYDELRANLDQLKEETSGQHSSFQREVAELRRQLAAASHPIAPTKPFRVQYEVHDGQFVK